MVRRAVLAGVLTVLLVVAQQHSITLGVPTPEPSRVGVNAITNRIYVASAYPDHSVSVIDGVRDRVMATIPLECCLAGVGVNPNTNRIYIANWDRDFVSVIDAPRNQIIATVPVQGFPLGVGVNAITNRIYVANYDGDSVSVIAGVRNKVVATIRAVGMHGPAEVGVNPTANRIYAVNNLGHSVSVIDGLRNRVIAIIPVGQYPSGVGINPTTNRIYVANPSSGSVSVIDGALNEVIATIDVGSAPDGVGVNPTTNRIYVANSASEDVSVIDGTRDVVIVTIPVGKDPDGVGVNPTTNRIYIANQESHNISVLVGNDLLKNPSFDADVDGDGLPDSWRSRNLRRGDGLDGDLGDVYDGRFSMNLTGGPDVMKQLIQRIDVSGPAGTVLNLEAFSKATASIPGQGRYQVEVQVVFAGETSAAFGLDYGRSPEGTFDWRRKARRFTVPKDYERLVVSVIYQNPTGRVWFDALHLWPAN